MRRRRLDHWTRKAIFSLIQNIEKRHSHRFSVLAEELKNETLFKKPEVSQWICTKCGHTHIGKEAPCKCPVCSHEQEYFKIFSYETKEDAFKIIDKILIK